MSNIVRFTKPTSIDEVLKYKEGSKPKYASKSSTYQGVANCACNTCVGNMIYYPDKRTVVGWLTPKCSVCGTSVNWSDADKKL